MVLTVPPEAETGGLLAPASKVQVVRVHWSALLGLYLHCVERFTEYVDEEIYLPICDFANSGVVAVGEQLR